MTVPPKLKNIAALIVLPRKRPEPKNKHKNHVRPQVIPADRSKQDAPEGTYLPLDQYEDTRVPCSACGRPILWTAQSQQYFYEAMRAHIFATVNLVCDRCRKHGNHDRHRQAQRAKARGRRRG